MNSQGLDDRNYNDYPAFQSTTEKSLTNNCSPREDWAYLVRHSWVQELGFKCAFVFAVLEKMTCSRGFSYMSNKEMARQCGVDITTIERGLKKLDEKGWIFRNYYSINRGTKRHIITKYHALIYWQKYLNQPNKPAKVKKAFLKKFLSEEIKLASKPAPKTAPILPLNSAGSPIPPCKTAGSTNGKIPSQTPQTEEVEKPPRKNAGCMSPQSCGSLKVKEYIKKTTALISARVGENPSCEESLLLSFIEKLERDLSLIGISQEEVNTAMDYAKEHPEIEETMTNPTGWFVQGFRKGWLYERFNAKSLESRKKELIERNKKISQEVCKKYSNLKMISVETSYKALEFIPLGSQCPGTGILFTDPRFILELEKALERYHLHGP